MSFLYNEIFAIIKQARPTLTSIKGIIIDGFRKMGGLIRVISIAMIIIMTIGSKSICQHDGHLYRAYTARMTFYLSVIFCELNEAVEQPRSGRFRTPASQSEAREAGVHGSTASFAARFAPRTFRFSGGGMPSAGTGG
jgi:hypothetical protein